jgi:hypothetical protein
MMARWWEGGDMPSLEERVAYIEGRFGDHVGAIHDLRSGLTESRNDSRSGLADVRRDIGELRTDLRNGLNDARGETAGVRTELGELRTEMNRRFEGVDARFVTLDGKIDRHFTWLVGIQVAVLVAVVGALVGSYYR